MSSPIAALILARVVHSTRLPGTIIRTDKISAVFIMFGTKGKEQSD